MERKDWLFEDEHTIRGFRSVGVLIHDNKLLVQRERQGTQYALPGGHVKTGETSEQAIIREFREETGAEVVCQRMLWVDESFWRWNGRDAHTIAFYYQLSFKDSSQPPDIVKESMASQKDSTDILLTWVPLEEVKYLDMYPPFIQASIGCLESGIEHFVYRE